MDGAAQRLCGALLLHRAPRGGGHVQDSERTKHILFIKTLKLFPPKGDYLGLKFRVIHRVTDSDWVDFDFGFSTVCPILVGHMRVWKNGLRSWIRLVKHPNKSQPNLGPRPDGIPYTVQ